MTSPSHRRAAGAHRALLGSAFILVSGAAQAALLADDFEDGVVRYTTTGVAGAVNIRPTSDVINTGGTNGFDAFFPNGGRFLVVGDAAGAIGNGSPAGPAGSIAGSTQSARFALGSFGAGVHRLGVAFDFVFDTSLAPGTTQARNPDDFVVTLRDSAGVLLELLRFDDVLRNEADRRGRFSGEAQFTLGGADQVWLDFGLTEYANSGDSAVGIDNIVLIPEAASIALLGIGMIALGSVRLRRRPAPA
jgi:hypothetical protein